MFDVRWVFHLFKLSKLYGGTFQHFVSIWETQHCLAVADKAKYSGLVKKVTTFMFVAKLALLKD